MTTHLRAGSYRVVQRVVDVDAHFDLPEGSSILGTSYTNTGAIQLLILEPTLTPLTEGGRRRAQIARPTDSGTPL